MIFISTRSETNCLQNEQLPTMLRAFSERIFVTRFILARLPHFGKLQKYLKHFFLDYYSSIWHKSCKIFIDYVPAIGLPFNGYYWRWCYCMVARVESTEKLYMYGKLWREDMSLIWKYWEGFIPFTLHWVECGLTSIRKLIKKSSSLATILI